MSNLILLFDHIDVLEIAHLAVKVKSVTDDELRRNGKSHIVRLETGLAALGFVKECDKTDAPGLRFFKSLTIMEAVRPVSTISSMMTTSIPSTLSVRPITSLTVPVVEVAS